MWHNNVFFRRYYFLNSEDNVTVCTLKPGCMTTLASSEKIILGCQGCLINLSRWRVSKISISIESLIPFFIGSFQQSFTTHRVAKNMKQLEIVVNTCVDLCIKGCLSLFNYYIEMSPMHFLMKKHGFFPSKTCFFDKKWIQ